MNRPHAIAAARQLLALGLTVDDVAAFLRAHPRAIRALLVA